MLDMPVMLSMRKKMSDVKDTSSWLTWPGKKLYCFNSERSRLIHFPLDVALDPSRMTDWLLRRPTLSQHIRPTTVTGSWVGKERRKAKMYTCISVPEKQSARSCNLHYTDSYVSIFRKYVCMKALICQNKGPTIYELRTNM